MTQNRLTDELNELDASVRTPRRTREHTERPKSWQPESTLPEPDKLPGYE